MLLKKRCTTSVPVRVFFSLSPRFREGLLDLVSATHASVLLPGSAGQACRHNVRQLAVGTQQYCRIACAGRQKKER